MQTLCPVFTFVSTDSKSEADKENQFRGKIPQKEQEKEEEAAAASGLSAGRVEPDQK